MYLERIEYRLGNAAQKVYGYREDRMLVKQSERNTTEKTFYNRTSFVQVIE